MLLGDVPGELRLNINPLESEPVFNVLILETVGNDYGPFSEFPLLRFEDRLGLAFC